MMTGCHCLDSLSHALIESWFHYRKCRLEVQLHPSGMSPVSVHCESTLLWPGHFPIDESQLTNKHAFIRLRTCGWYYWPGCNFVSCTFARTAGRSPGISRNDTSSFVTRYSFWKKWWHTFGRCKRYNRRLRDHWLIQNDFHVRLNSKTNNKSVKMKRINKITEAWEENSVNETAHNVAITKLNHSFSSERPFDQSLVNQSINHSLLMPFTWQFL